MKTVFNSSAGLCEVSGQNPSAVVSGAGHQMITDLVLDSQVKANREAKKHSKSFFLETETSPDPHVTLEVLWGHRQEHMYVLTRELNQLKCRQCNQCIFCILC